MKFIKGQEDNFYSSSAWKKVRKQAIKRDDGYCQRCLIKYNIITTSSLEGHHIKPRSKPKYKHLELELTNIATLCKSCNLALGTQEFLDFPWEVQADREFFL